MGAAAGTANSAGTIKASSNVLNERVSDASNALKAKGHGKCLNVSRISRFLKWWKFFLTMPAQFPQQSQQLITSRFDSQITA
jgi:hypothetical protein